MTSMALRLHTSSLHNPFNAPTHSLKSFLLRNMPVRSHAIGTNHSRKQWRKGFGVSELSETSVRSAAETGKSYVHDFLDVHSRPVLIVDASKHFAWMLDPSEDDEKLCIFLIEKATSKLPDGKEQIHGIMDLRAFGTKNADLKFVTFLFDALYYYYPRQLAEVLFVDAPFVYKPLWQLIQPFLKSYDSLTNSGAEDIVAALRELSAMEDLNCNISDH
ncbi:hypothetical protein LguiB_009752 [Lonicera macranthoides]